MDRSTQPHGRKRAPRFVVLHGHDPVTGTYAALQMMSGERLKTMAAEIQGVSSRAAPAADRESSDFELDGAAPAAERVGSGRAEIGEYNRRHRRKLRQRTWAPQPALLPRKVAGGFWHHPGSFLTLTLPGRTGWRDEYLDARLCKRFLARFWKRFEREFPGVWAIWVMELQERPSFPDLPPAWHFHLLVRWPDGARATGREWDVRKLWVSRAWAESVAGVRPGGLVDGDHVAAGTGLDRLVTPAKLQRYVEKAGTKGPPGLSAPAPRRRSGGGVAPAVTVANEMAKWIQKLKPDLNAPEVAAALANQGAWWNILGRDAYNACCSVLARELPAPLAARVWAAMVGSWEGYATVKGFEFEHGPPQWIEGRHAYLALRDVQTTGQALLFDEPGESPPIDLRTGELLELDERDFGKAASA